MIEHLKLINHKALKECFLYNLGKINIICGKNNNGKSTILESIGLVTNHFTGKILKDDDLAFISELAGKRIVDWGEQPKSPGTVQKDTSGNYEKALSLASKTRNVWFDDESTDFFDKANEEFKSLVNRKGLVIEETLDRVFATFLTVQDPIMFLPPKRNLELEVTLGGTPRLEPEGKGVLYSLFYARNKNDDSSDYLFYERLSKAFSSISSGYRFNVEMPPRESSTTILNLYFSYKTQGWVSANDCGLGLQDLLVILFFALHADYQVILIEEPESHMHPEMQRKLLRFLREETDKQYFLSTHSILCNLNYLIFRQSF